MFEVVVAEINCMLMLVTLAFSGESSASRESSLGSCGLSCKVLEETVSRVFPQPNMINQIIGIQFPVKSPSHNRTTAADVTVTFALSLGPLSFTHSLAWGCVCSWSGIYAVWCSQLYHGQHKMTDWRYSVATYVLYLLRGSLLPAVSLLIARW